MSTLVQLGGCEPLGGGLTESPQAITNTVWKRSVGQSSASASWLRPKHPLHYILLPSPSSV